MLESHKPEILDKFYGLFDRGDNFAVPKDHFQDCRNIDFFGEGFGTRQGVDRSVTFGSVRRIFTYKRPGEVTRRLILDSSGNLYDSADLGTPILSIPAMTDFSAQPFFGRVYISPHNGVEGLPGESIYVWDGTILRVAGGLVPTGTLVATQSASAGFVEFGTHLFAVSFETASGFITKPGPAIYAIHVAPGGFKVDLSSIPTGPAGTVARRILATKVIDPYTGDQDNQEFFFVPEGRIANNTDTTLTVDFFDNDLQSSADYLFDQRETIPACLHLSAYKSRLVALNYDGGNSVALISNAAEPESFSELDGFIVVDPSSNDTLKSAVEFRSTLYLFKSLSISGVTETEGLSPSEWKPESVDFGIGTEVFGVQMIIDAEGTSLDKFSIITRLGIEVFNGVVQSPALTWKIENFWKTRVNFAAANKIQLFNDPSTSSLYVNLPIDGATIPNVILYGNYSRGLDPVNIRWSIWSFPFSNLCIAMDVDTTNHTPFLLIGSTSGNIYNYPSVGFNDDGTAIDSYGKSALVRIDNSGAIIHCVGLRISAEGNGLLQSVLYDKKSVRTQVLANTELSLNPTGDYLRKPNFQSERIAVRVRTSLFGEYFRVSALSLFIKPLWSVGPQ